MSDTFDEITDFPPEDDYDELPSSKNEKKKKKKEKKEKKKGGAGGKILCLILGFFLGIFFVVGAVAGGVYYVVSRPIDDTVNTIDKTTGAELYEVFFGSTDENGEYTAGILNEKYAEKKIMDLIGDVGDAIDGLSADDGSLSLLNEISPKIGEAIDGIVETLEEYGIRLDTQTILVTPLKGDDGLEHYIQNSMSNIAAGDLLSTLSDEPLSPLFLSICYGKENVDYTIDAEGNVTMINGAQKKTIGELTTTDISGLFDDILLSDVMDLNENYQNKILMHLVYGKEGVRYTLNMVDGKPQVTMETMRVYLSTSDGAIYDEEKKLLTGVSVDTAANTYTDAKGNVYAYQKGSAETVDGKTCDTLLLCDANGEYLKYSPTAVSDLIGSDSVFEKLVSNMTIGDIFDEEAVNDNIFLKHLKDETVESLPDAIAKLTVGEIFGDDADDNFFLKSLKDETLESLPDKIETLTVGDIFDEDAVNDNVFLKHLKNETIKTLPDKIGDLKVTEVYKDQIYEKDGKTLKGSWKYLLTNEHGKIDTSITVTDMQTMVDNMQRNIYDATLFDLKKDGVLNALDDDMLNTKIKTSVGGMSLGVSFAGKTYLGDLTVHQMLAYVSQVLKVLG